MTAKQYSAYVFLLFSAASISMARAEQCTVADPTGTSLAIRDAPRGTKTGSLVNGDNVQIEQVANDNRGLPWARISGAAAGWVFKNYLACGDGRPSSPAKSSAGQIMLSCSGTFVCNRKLGGSWFSCDHSPRQDTLEYLVDFDRSTLTRGGGTGAVENVRITENVIETSSARSNTTFNRKTGRVESFDLGDTLQFSFSGFCKAVHDNRF